ncbi:MAG: tetraacyldisaccharide 4'-kinase [Candidatus Omnitrophica bacterium]|nr:tetraacyldisaccharide 4'-kinase [Candidatus Omnitrophota bacterium]
MQPVRGGLAVLSRAYAGILRLRLLLYTRNIMIRQVPPLAVISVGNVTAGGTGKTPLVALVVEYVQGQGLPVALISRGYGAKKNDPGTAADEPEMLRRRYPGLAVFVRKDRMAAMRLAAAAGCRVAVLDDAFGRISFRKNLDIVCIDALNPFSNGQVMPRGLLRLPLSYLRLADIFVINHAAAGAHNIPEIMRVIRQWNSRALVCRAQHRPVRVRSIQAAAMRPVDALAGRRVALLCGIAVPEYFRRTVQETGAIVAAEFFFPDHHAFSAAELSAVASHCSREQLDLIVTTEKDLPRLEAQAAIVSAVAEVVVLEIRLNLEDYEKDFAARIRGVCTA